LPPQPEVGFCRAPRPSRLSCRYSGRPAADRRLGSRPAYLLWLFQRTSFGTPTEEFADEHIHDVHVSEWIAWTPLLVLILVLGVYPHLLFQVTDPVLTSMGETFQALGP
jgi:NADH:ubiquinone oxidoreductase subunit 4 (subunit M)